MSIALVSIAAVLVLVAAAAWLAHEARRIERPEYADYNARMDAADRWYAGREDRASHGAATVRGGRFAVRRGGADDTLPA